MRNFFQRPDRKVIVDLVTSLLTFGVAAVGLEVTPEVAALIGKVTGFVVAYIVPNKSN